MQKDPRFKLLLAATVALVTVFPASAESWDELWPHWRGPHRDGRAGGEAWPRNLSCFEPMWRVELGKGYPGPIVAPDRVFVAESEDGQEIVRALDRAGGRELWRASWPGSWKVPFFAAKNGSWVRSTPAFDGESLYVGGIREVLVKLDAGTGEERWRVDFPARFGTGVPDFGFASSPLVAGEHLYVQAANSIVKQIAGWALARIHLPELRLQVVVDRATLEALLREGLQSLGARLGNARPRSDR